MGGADRVPLVCHFPASAHTAGPVCLDGHHEVPLRQLREEALVDKLINMLNL